MSEEIACSMIRVIGEMTLVKQKTSSKKRERMGQKMNSKAK